MKVSVSGRVTLFRPEFLSITAGVIGAALVFAVTLIALLSAPPAAGPLIRFFQAIFPGYALTPVGLVVGIFWAFIYGFVFGFMVGWLYTWLINKKVRQAAQDVFDYDPTQTVNVIQAGEGDEPYTIVLVANPAIKRHDGSYEPDPIIEDEDLFVRVVTRCLRSFANNELLRLPEILPRLKLVTVFAREEAQRRPEDANALCQEVPETIILAPRPETDSVIYQYVKNAGVPYADVIMVLSGHKRFIQSSARFTQEARKEDSPANQGQPFRFSFTENFDDPVNGRIHAYCARVPGVAALSAWDDRLKTPVHEFAHAMSSVENGAIVDEYLDSYVESTEAALHNTILNRKLRANPTDPVPKLFGKYQLGNGPIVEYYSDRARTDKEPDWRSYVPEKPHPGISCIMDLAYFDYRYDKLIFDFMYDRLLTKLNRSGSCRNS
ncbi:MAG: hypothetical protein D6681_15105 [Calditrichaeota bacterium]|nr:MAG: hypothetical protein D6681_15105 [Calditrichota bacterium]